MNTEDKKCALRMFQYGLFILTSRSTDPAETMPYAAATVTWVSQASFEPPLVMVALRRDSWTHKAVKQSGVFVLNILRDDQKPMAGRFFKQIEVNGNTMNGHAFETGTTGAPLFLEAPAYLECEEQTRVELGDHTVVIARIVNAGVRDGEATPILLRDTGWSYGG
jgi:flavin reductase (DIM6/NTAB) family NADH-FMN oxidoreductase RutF